MARAVLGPAAAVILAACQVNVDGAPCAAPGAVEDCPLGQACGNDLRCSERALSCAASRCVPGAETRCAGPTGRELVVGCTAADPVCGRAVEEDCAARGLACGSRSGAAACECPEYLGTTLAADPAGSRARDALPYPTGAATPRECRFGRLGDALEAAAARAPVPASVLVHGDAGVPAVFGDDTAETWPLRVEWNVALAGASPPGGPTVVRGEPGASALVSLAGTLEGIRVERPPTPGGGARGPGIETSCGASGMPSLRTVEVDGGLVLDPEGSGTTGLGAGVRVSGDCGATLVGVDVVGAAGPALALDPTNAATVTVLGGSFNGSLVGVSIAGSGTVTLAPDPETATSVVVAGNVREGVQFTRSATIDATLRGGSVLGNGGTGVWINSIDEVSRLGFIQCDIAENGNTAPRTYGPVGGQREVGGILVSQSELQNFVFSGNRVFSNARDQLGFETDSSWSIAATTCGEQTNVFRCVSQDDYAVGVRGAGTVDAALTVWPGDPPVYWASSGVLSLDAYCVSEPGVPQIPACP